MSEAKPELTLYVRLGCHLCEDMQQQLMVELQGRDVALRIVEISANPELEAQYGTLVPVLEGGGEPICHYFLDLIALQRYMSGT